VHRRSDELSEVVAGVHSTARRPRFRREVPAGAPAFPFRSIVVACPLCGELRRYLPSEVFLGRPDLLVTRQQRAGGR
jgi:hypothetical protein